MSTHVTAGEDLDLAYVELYVADLEAERDVFVELYDFEVVGTAGSSAQGFRSVALTQGGSMLVLTQGLADEHPASLYVLSHGDGVADIAMRTADVPGVFAAAVAAGATPVAEPRAGADGLFTATIRMLGDVTHTLVQTSPTGQGGPPAGFTPAAQGQAQARTPRRPGDALRLDVVDHFAVCVPAGTLDRTISLYESALGFRQTFEERITVGAQAMESKVVQSASSTVTFTILEPDPELEAGQIDEFLKNHGGAGIQHVAFATDDIARTVASMQRRGVEFLSTPGAYYDLLPDRILPGTHGVDELRKLNILVDEDQGGELFQIFTRSSHPRRTLFYEVIERAGARLFGSNNIKALYEAVEHGRSGN
ncbi:4-hydroxyphenylpyruvate dioxygenase [Streptomyces sp. ISL-12]|uniref:4-hydroxyphenylpyruvate dioxygenase n=1 Tax=Streptomyces sp. ISL-12 TaxID=2819177 RepID=UPI001BE6BD83|nr:4-hydroxyphenylpyruvate dioxygenase [Streptomyces sp. ISL-12]MBT2414377.1 4-hydroxyphenylpyruvate dioxygenase [Streptomyces sp. ISL-12]